ncbi:hypothetical protein FRC04_005957 [Tulasnella sp. 424]|nr:hypothetical protein FRC04_005957 [Tulasnella sp. 424]
MHKQGVVHGNIKASNLLIGDDGEVLLCDFGLTRTTDLKTPTEMKGAGAIRWQSPELLNGHSKSFKSDVYAFGMTIVEVLTGSVPFPDLETDRAVISTVLIEGKRPPKNPTESSAGLSYENVWAVAEACWPALPEERISMTRALQLIQADPALCDIGSFITSISKDAVRVNGHFCDVFEGMHLTAGRVALKRLRIGGIGDEDATIR